MLDACWEWGHLRPVVLCNLLSEDKRFLVALQLLSESLVQCISNGDLLGAACRGITPEAQD